MVKFTRISIDNYKSLGSAVIYPQAGIYKVLGENLDSGYPSNGAGKSSAVQAIMLGLYNRDFTGANLEFLSNRATGKGWKIEVDFEHSNGSSYTVINSRQPNVMILVKDGKKYKKGANSVLPEIEKLLGMGWETFKLTHFITSQTIIDLTKNLSQPQLFNDILHLVEVNELDKKLHGLAKETSQSLQEAERELYQLEKIKSLTDFSTRYNIPQLEEELENSSNALESLQIKYDKAYNKFKVELEGTQGIISSGVAEQSKLKKSLHDGICNTCGTLLLDKDSLRLINERLQVIDQELTTSRQEESSIRQRMLKLTKTFEEARSTLQTYINGLNADLLSAVELQNVSPENLEEDYKKAEANVLHLSKTADLIDKLRKNIKGGAVVEDIMTRFFELVQLKIDEYSELINMAHYSVRVMTYKNGMLLEVRDGDNHVTIESLSAGEKTRLALLTLMAMLSAMHAVSESETNYLAFDEASASFDKSGVYELSRLFSHLKGMGQSIFMITHGTELDLIPYDYELKAMKSSGISTISVYDA